MLEALSQRTIIIGNSGSGKSTLAEHLASRFQIPMVDLDTLHWEGNGYGQKRNEDIAQRMTAEWVATPRWIVEGVYGWLVVVAIPRATALIWLDLPWDECRAGLLARGQSRGADAASFTELLAWAEAYRIRKTSSSFEGHFNIYEAFTATKRRLQSRSAVNEFIACL